MSNADIRGRFVWHELMTTDPDAASAFYSRVTPWTTQESGMPSYTLWMSGKKQAGGLMALPTEGSSGTPPHWIIYIGTPDVDATAAAAEKLGGKVVKAPSDIPNVGRFAVLTDPQGAAFALFTPKPGSGDGASPASSPGDFGWHELGTTDPEGALKFYSELFGWSKGAAHNMGEMGTYQIFSHGGQDVGGVYRVRDNSTPPSWLSYVNVVDAGKAASAAKAAGARILHGPMEVPGGHWIVVMLDPQGGAFAVVEPPRTAAKKAAAAPTAAKAAPAPKAAPAKVAPPKATPPKASPPKAATPPAAAAKKAAPAKKAAARKAAGKKAAKKSAASARKGAAVRKPAKKKATAASRAVAKRKAPAKAKAKAKKHR